MTKRDEAILRNYQDLTDCLKVSVKIDHNEVLKIVVRDLINKRNCHSNKVVDSFDKVLRYYLIEEEFQKYVIDGKDVED